MTKYITMVDHLTSGKNIGWTYLANNGKDKCQAIAKATADGLKQEEVFCVLVAKRDTKTGYYVPIYRIYPDGSSEDLVKSNWGGWGKHYKMVLDSEIKVA